ncbi:MAG: ThiF family adenylyltransferase [Streptosporangiaceae bacterium]|nr:ThiF family adenylyltransferase [Streptosporangiaceae bacterium]
MRYTRHAPIPGWDQELLRAAHVVICGVGALGTEVARLLAQAGVGALTLCDADTVEESNLSRGALFDPADIGAPKVAAAARTLATICPETLVNERRNWLVCGIGLAELRDASLVVSCLDTRAARIQLAERCTLVGVALLDGGTRPWGGEVRYYPAGGPCYGCGLTDSVRATRDDPLSCARPDPEGVRGASAAVSALVASWMSATALRVLFGQPVFAGVLRLDTAYADTHRMRHPRDPRCPLHERIPPELVEPAPLSSDATVAELLDWLLPGEAALGWTEFSNPGGPAGLFGVWLSDAPGPSRLRDLGVAPREIIRIINRREGQRDRFIELAGPPEGGCLCP